MMGRGKIRLLLGFVQEDQEPLKRTVASRTRNSLFLEWECPGLPYETMAQDRHFSSAYDGTN